MYSRPVIFEEIERLILLKMKKGLLILFCLICLTTLRSSFTEKEKSETIAKYLVSLVRYFEWPGEMQKGNFKIGVFGSFEMYRSIAEETMGVGLQNRNVDVINLARLDQAGFSKPHILIISENQCTPEILKRAEAAIGSQATLIITDKQGALQFGSAINFVPSNDRLVFEINKNNVVKNGILINKAIESFASRVIP